MQAPSVEEATDAVAGEQRAPGVQRSDVHRVEAAPAHATAAAAERCAQSGQFNEAVDCCICWESIPTKVVLPCGHLMCLTCIENMEMDHCALKCAKGAFDRVRTLQQHGFSVTTREALLPPEVILKKQRFGPLDHAGFVAAGTMDIPQFATLEVCPDEACSEYNKEVLNQAYGESMTDADEFDWDLCKSTRSDCMCGATRHIKQLFFKDCFANVELCEKFVNGELYRSHFTKDARCQPLTLEMPGHYTVINVSTRDRPFSWLPSS